MAKAQGCHKQIDYGRNEKAGGHEAADVAVVCDEAVQELAHSIYEQECRSDKSEFSSRKHTPVDKRLLEHTDAHSTDIVETVCGSHPPEGLPPERLVSRCDTFCGNLLRRRLAYSVE